MNNPAGERHVAAMADGLRDVADAFADEMKRRPTLNELLEILAWAARSCPENTLSDVHPANITAFRAQPSKGTGAPPQAGMSASLSELNDNVFSLAAEVLCSVAPAPSLDQLSELIAAALNRIAPDALAGVRPGEIARIRVDVAKRGKTVTRPGDVVAIPASNGRHHLAVVLDKNAFGTAYGLFEGTNPLRPLSQSSHPPVRPHPVYSGDELVAKGRWRIVGHDEGLRSLFPAEPEIYHRQSLISGGPEIGPYGSGETPSGTMRKLTQEEAKTLGLLTGEYRQAYTAEQLEQYLEQQTANVKP
jgi:hypothetical protein